METEMEVFEENGCAYNYVVTAQRPTAVNHVAVGNLTAENEINLVVGKSTVFELYTLKKEGLQPVLESPINGRIAAMEVFRQPGDKTDSVLLLTERMNISIIAYNPETHDWRTLTTGSVRQRIGNEARNGPMAFLDPTSRIVGLHLYDGQLRVASIVNGNFCHIFNISMEELNIVHLTFLSASHLRCVHPVLAVLYEDTRHQRHLKTYTLRVDEQELEEAQWFHTSFSHGTADMIIPDHAYGGLLVISDTVITYLSCHDRSQLTIPVHETAFKSYARIDGQRYVLSDHLGVLYSLHLIARENVVERISCQKLGEATPASCMAYLDSGIMFLGSKTGDSQLIKLVQKSANPIQELSRFTNLGPILDFCVVDLERQGQCQIVTCSGAFSQGTLRVIRNGIGITDQATVDLTGIKGLWSLKKGFKDDVDSFLVVSFINETRVLAFSLYDQNELAEAQIPGFQDTKQTLHCANVLHDNLIQITHNEVVMMSCRTWQRLVVWQPEDTAINMSSTSPSQILVACKNGQVIYLCVSEEALTEKWRFVAENEISCLDITPIGEDAITAKFAAVGTWDLNVHLFNLESQTEITKIRFSQEIIPRSVLFSTFEGTHYLLVAMGDGRLRTHEIDPVTGMLRDERHVSVGTKPVTLSRFWCRGTSHVFASSDRPTVIYGEQKKLMFSNLNEQHVNYLTSFNTTNAPECLALAKDGGLMIGNIDDIQKLHIKTIRLKEMPRRICHQPETRTYAVLVESSLSDGRPQSYVRIYDEESFELKVSVPFDFTETGFSVLSMNLPNRQDGGSVSPFFIVGTVYVVPTEHEPFKGRMLVYSYQEVLGQPQLVLITEKDFKGALYSLKPMQDRILVTVNSKVHVVEWKVTENGGKSLQIACTQHGHISALYSDVRNNFVIIGDLMRSIALLIYNRDTNELEARARDPSSNWMTALKALDDDVYLGAENSHNLFTVKKVANGVKDEEGRLETIGQYHLGDYVNVLREGSLVANTDLNEFLRPPVLFGTTSGQIGLILSLPAWKFEFLTKLQKALERVIRPVGLFEHSEYRSFWNERQSKEAKNFIDGDLVEAFLDLKTPDMHAVANILGVTTEEIYKTVEDLSKLH